MSSPRGLVVGGIGGMRGTGAAAIVDDGGVVFLLVVVEGVGDGVRRIGICVGFDTNGSHEKTERKVRGGLRMLRCMFRLLSERFACGTYLAGRRSVVASGKYNIDEREGYDTGERSATHPVAIQAISRRVVRDSLVRVLYPLLIHPTREEQCQRYERNR